MEVFPHCINCVSLIILIIKVIINDYDYDNANDIDIDIDKHNRNHNNRRCDNAQLTLEARQRTPILFQFCARQKNTAKQQKHITVHPVGPSSCFAG